MQEISLFIKDIDFVRLIAMRPPPELRAELDRAIVVPSESMPAGIVTMGARVRYRDQQTGKLREVELVYPEDADPACARISVLAPVGAALLGLAEGQEIDWDFPDGTLRRLTVVEVIPAAPSH